MMSQSIPQTLWNARVPISVTHPSSPNSPFIASIPRFSYLSLLLPRLSAFFGTPCSSFHFEDVQLRNLAVGLLVDLYQPTLPWRLTVNEGVGWDIGDTFLNSVKEVGSPQRSRRWEMKTQRKPPADTLRQADFIRNGNANQIMKMSKQDTTQLWHAVIDNDFAAFNRINTRLLNAPTALKHIPIRIYVPDASPTSPSPSSAPPHSHAATGSFKIVQTLVPAKGRDDRKSQLLGQALKAVMPGLFPSSRDPVLASVILHGATVPFDAPLVELMREAAYPDGWLCLVVTV